MCPSVWIRDTSKEVDFRSVREQREGSQTLSGGGVPIVILQSIPLFSPSVRHIPPACQV